MLGGSITAAAATTNFCARKKKKKKKKKRNKRSGRMERRKNVEKWASVFWEGRVAAVAAADYEKHQQTQQWPSLTLLHTYTYLECSKQEEELRKKREERERHISRRNQLLVPMPMPPTSSLL